MRNAQVIKICFVFVVLIITHTFCFAQADSTEKKEKCKRLNYSLEAGTMFIPKTKAERIFYSKPTIGYQLNLILNFNLNQTHSLSYNIGYYDEKQKFKANSTYWWYDSKSNSFFSAEGVSDITVRFNALTSSLSYQINKKINNKISGYGKIGSQIELISEYSRKELFSNDTMFVEYSWKRDKLDIFELNQWLKPMHINSGVSYPLFLSYPIFLSSLGIKYKITNRINVTSSLSCSYGFRINIYDLYERRFGYFNNRNKSYWNLSFGILI